MLVPWGGMGGPPSKETARTVMHCREPCLRGKSPHPTDKSMFGCGGGGGGDCSSSSSSSSSSL